MFQILTAQFDLSLSPVFPLTQQDLLSTDVLLINQPYLCLQLLRVLLFELDNVLQFSNLTLIPAQLIS